MLRHAPSAAAKAAEYMSSTSGKVGEAPLRGRPSGAIRRSADWASRSGKQPWHTRRFPNLVLLFALTIGSLVITVQVLTSVLQAQKAARSTHQDLGQTPQPVQTLRFSTCSDAAEQRLSILYGVMMAVELGRAVVLPRLTISSNTASTAQGSSSVTTEVPFSQLYNEDAFIKGLATLGVDVLREEQSQDEDTKVIDLASLSEPVQQLHTSHREVLDLRVSCPLYKLKPEEFRDSNMPVVWQLLESLQPNLQRSKTLRAVAAKLSAQGRSHSFNYVKLEAGQAWESQCKQLESQPTGISSRDCLGNVNELDKVLEAYNVPTSTPLFVSVPWNDADATKVQQVLDQLQQSGYKVFTSKDYPQAFTGDQQLDALLDFELSLLADRYMGNSASTSGALALLQRRHTEQWSAFYNMGPVLLEQRIPAQMLPWVFAYTSTTPQNDYMVQVAIKSALQFRTVQPYCIWSGNTTSPIYQWLESMGVVMISHRLEWEDDVWALVESHMTANAQQSSLFSDKTQLLNDFARVDIPIIPALDQYNYVLLTSPYVLFMKEVSLASMASMLPNVITMHSGRGDDANIPVSGAMLLNLLELRESYEEFKMFVLSSRHGGVFPGYGPGASGAFAQFYEPYLTRVESKTAHEKPRLAISTSCNYDSSALMLHFDGPSVHELVEYYRTGNCPLGWMCHAGLRKSACPFIQTWQSHLSEEENHIGVAMWYICETIYAPQLQWQKFGVGDEAHKALTDGLLLKARDSLAKAEAIATHIVA